MLLIAAVVSAAVVYHAARRHDDELQALRAQVQSLTTAQEALRSETRELREARRESPTAAAAAVARPTTPSREIVLNLEGAPFKGDANAPVTLVEFTDYECSFCARHVRATVPGLERDYIAAGRLKYVFRNFPIESTHKQAFKAHEAAICAGEQGKFWEMHDLLFANQRELGAEQISAHAQALGLEPRSFHTCLDTAVRAGEVRRDLAEGRNAGVTATPTFFLGVTQPGSNALKVSRTIKGAKPYATFKEAIEALLATGPAS